MAEIRVEPKRKKGIPLIYILLALIALAIVAWVLLGREDEAVETETAPAVSFLETLPASIPLSHTHSPLPGEGEEMQGLSVRAA